MYCYYFSKHPKFWKLCTKPHLHQWNMKISHHLLSHLWKKLTIKILVHQKMTLWKIPIYWCLLVYCGILKLQWQLCYILHNRWFTSDWDGWEEIENVRQTLKLRPRGVQGKVQRWVLSISLKCCESEIRKGGKGRLKLQKLSYIYSTTDRSRNNKWPQHYSGVTKVKKLKVTSSLNTLKYRHDTPP